MGVKVDIAELIHKGGVFELDAFDATDAYKKISAMLKLPGDIEPDFVYKALCEREKVLSTAVGNGIALPHTRSPILKDEDTELISVVYLKTPIDMNAPDGRPVSVMFVLLAGNTQVHLAVLSALAALFNNSKFRLALEKKVSEEKLAAVIRELA